jgi:hypothetical protein
LDPETGNVIIPNHNVKELRDILRCYEDVYRDQLPELGLQQWARAIHGYLTHDLLDPERSQLVTMDNIHKYLMIVLRRSVEAGMADVYPTILLDAAQRMVHGIDTVVNLEDETAELDD